MFFFILGVDQCVINEYHHELVQVIVENPIHVVHENRWSVSHTEWHY